MKPVKQERPTGCEVRFEIGAGYSGPGYWFAECRCGWAGRPCEFKYGAELEAQQHMEAAPLVEEGGES